MPTRALLFDIDGTLVDSNEYHVDAWVEAFARHGLSPDRDVIRGQIGKGGDVLVPALFPDLAADEQEALETAHGEVFKARYLHKVQPFPDAAALVRRSHEAGLKVALASSASEGELDHYLDLLGIRDVVDATTSTDDVETSKPAPDIFATAAKRLGVEGADALAIGDTPYDVASAGGTGIPTVALLSGGFSADALDGAVAVHADAAELLRRFPEWLR